MELGNRWDLVSLSVKDINGKDLVAITDWLDMESFGMFRGNLTPSALTVNDVPNRPLAVGLVGAIMDSKGDRTIELRDGLLEVVVRFTFEEVTERTVEGVTKRTVTSVHATARLEFERAED
ncbi:MAG: hypothetical protein ACR2RB_13970 [Gammaproteobacteria bacterium]